MKYYMAVIDVYDHFNNKPIYAGQLFTTTEFRNNRFTKKDKKEIFLTIKTSSKNTYILYGIRRFKNSAFVEVVKE